MDMDFPDQPANLGSLLHLGSEGQPTPSSPSPVDGFFVDNRDICDRILWGMEFGREKIILGGAPGTRYQNPDPIDLVFLFVFFMQAQRMGKAYFSSYFLHQHLVVCLYCLAAICPMVWCLGPATTESFCAAGIGIPAWEDIPFKRPQIYT